MKDAAEKTATTKARLQEAAEAVRIARTMAAWRQDASSHRALAVALARFEKLSEEAKP